MTSKDSGRAFDWRGQLCTVEGRSFRLGDVSGGRMYHGSIYAMREGDVVRLGVRPANFKQSAKDSISVTSLPERAAYWARDAAGPSGEYHVYEVEPLGPVKPWRVAPADYGRSFQLYEGRTETARVVRELPIS
jgi:hypothetical protein